MKNAINAPAMPMSSGLRRVHNWTNAMTKATAITKRPSSGTGSALMSQLSSRLCHAIPESAVFPELAIQAVNRTSTSTSSSQR